MTSIPISEARERLADLGNRVALRGERLIVERRGKDLFALVPLEDVELLERLEDQIDLEAIRASKGEPSKPWDEVKKALGL
jgi:antitoxin Phd